EGVAEERGRRCAPVPGAGAIIQPAGCGGGGKEFAIVGLFRFLFRLFLGKRLPLTQGSLRVAGPHGPIRIHRDRYGIPLIEARDLLDGIFAVGFCHGQDRAFQLELLARVARGTVSAMVGAAALPLDRLSRRIGFSRSATQQMNALEKDIRETLSAYAAGVTAGT